MYHRVVVCIDFGTACSGYAYSHISEKDEIICKYYWPEQPDLYPKTSSSILYTGTKPQLFGYPALYAQSATFPNQKLVSYFKLLLQNDVTLTYLELPKNVGIEKVISDYLKFLVDDLEIELKEKIGESISIKENVKFILTVPVTWSEEAKHQMRNCAINAGIPANKLTLTLEPEAAACYIKKKTFDDLQTAFITVDAGGATVDVQMHKITRSGFGTALKELTVPIGDFCGSKFIDDDFIRFLRKMFPEQVFKERILENHKVYKSIMKQFEIIKKKFKGDGTDETGYIEIPSDILDLVEGDFDFVDEACPIDMENGEVMLHPHVLKEFFDSQISKINSMIEHHIQQAAETPSIVLVGGFSSSEYVQKCIKESFKNHKIIIPVKPESAVLQGGVYYGWNPTILSVRKARYSFGIIIMVLASVYASGENLQDLNWNEEKNAYYAKSIDILVCKGQNLPSGKVVRRVYHPYKKHMTASHLRLMALKDEADGFIPLEKLKNEHKEPKQLCDVEIQSPDTTLGVNRRFLVDFKVDEIELSIFAVDESSGSVAEVSIDYSEANSEPNDIRYAY